MLAFGITILLWISPGLLALGGRSSVAWSIAVAQAVPEGVVYSSGHVPITAMIRHGLVLDVAAAIVIVPMVVAPGRLLF